MAQARSMQLCLNDLEYWEHKILWWKIAIKLHSCGKANDQSFWDKPRNDKEKLEGKLPFSSRQSFPGPTKLLCSVKSL